MAEKENGVRINQHFHCIANEFEEFDSCNSSDALCVYEKQDGDDVTYDAFCFSCGQHFSKEYVHDSSLAPALGITEGLVVDRKKFTLAPKAEPLTKEQIGQLRTSVGFSKQPYRKITPETLTFFWSYD